MDLVDHTDIVRWFAALSLVSNVELFSSPVQLHAELRTGVLLCQLLNIIQPGTVPHIHENGVSNKKSALLNLGLFVTGCRQIFKRDAFQSEFRPDAFYSHAEGLHRLLAVLHYLMELHIQHIRSETSQPQAATSATASTAASTSTSTQKAYKDASKPAQQISDTRTDPAAAEAPFLKSLDTGRRAVALYAYAATRTDELTFAEGDTIELISTPDEGWWEGRSGMPA